MAQRSVVLVGLFVLAALVSASPAMAQGDEIQVYDGGLADVGVANLTWHNNFTPNGIKTPSFPGAVVSKAIGLSMKMAVSFGIPAVTGWSVRT